MCVCMCVCMTGGTKELWGVWGCVLCDWGVMELWRVCGCHVPGRCYGIMACTNG